MSNIFCESGLTQERLREILGVSSDFILRGTRSDLEFSRLTSKIAALTPEDQTCIELIADRLIYKNKA